MAGSCSAKGLSVGSEKQLEFPLVIWAYNAMGHWAIPIYLLTNQSQKSDATQFEAMSNTHWQSYCHHARTVYQSMTTGIRPRELLRSRIKILHMWIWCTNLMFMMKNKKLSFQNMQVASDVINLKIISVKMPIWIPKMLKSLIMELCAYLIR